MPPYSLNSTSLSAVCCDILVFDQGCVNKTVSSGFVLPLEPGSLDQKCRPEPLAKGSKLIAAARSRSQSIQVLPEFDADSGMQMSRVP